MNLPYQSPAVDREHRVNSALEQGIDPAIFGLSWDDVAGGLGSAMNFLAPHAKAAAKQFATSAISDL